LYSCGCISGYVLRPDLRTCKALGGAVKLIMANRGDIRQVTLSNNQYTSIIKGLPNAIALDYHYEQNLLFWSDVSADVIKNSFLNGTNVKDVIKWGLESPGGLAVDWIHDLLFWTDSGTRRVEVSTFDGKLRAVVAANDLDKPRAIVVHPGK
jgi:low-density lipoprotein receptor-related protein 4